MKNDALRAEAFGRADVCAELDRAVWTLRAENARYREALEGIAPLAEEAVEQREKDCTCYQPCDCGASDARDRLSAALAVAALSVSPAGIWLTLEQAREIEWAGWDDTLNVECCPACMTTANLGDDHSSDCWLAEKLAKAEAGHNVTGEDEIIEDGFGNAWSAKCPACGGRIEVVRPGKAQCENCG